MSKLFKMIGIELSISWKMLLVSSIGISILALIPIMIASDINPTEDYQHLLGSSISLISPSLTQIYLYTVIMRLRNVIRDKSTLDKNRVAFLTHGRSTVAFSKVFIDTIAFIFPMILTTSIGVPMVLAKNGVLNSDYIGKLIVLLFGITFVYIGTSLGMRFIDTLHMDKIKKALLMGTWIMLTLAVTVVGAIVVGILGHSPKDGLTNSSAITDWLKSKGLDQYSGKHTTSFVIKDSEMANHGILSYEIQHINIPAHSGVAAKSGFQISNIVIAHQELYTDSALGIQNFFLKNQVLVSVMPILNFITPFLPFYKLMDTWTVIPLMSEILIFVLVIWRPLTRRLKTHLTT